jgi:hypothetical protein
VFLENAFCLYVRWKVVGAVMEIGGRDNERSEKKMTMGMVCASGTFGVISFRTFLL